MKFKPQIKNIWTWSNFIDDYIQWTQSREQDFESHDIFKFSLENSNAVGYLAW